MENASKFNKQLDTYFKEGWISGKIRNILVSFYESYKATLLAHHINPTEFISFFELYLDLIKAQLQNPHAFKPYHQQVVTPFDYYKFGVEFLRPLVDQTLSVVQGHDELREITHHLKQGHNIVFLANHQTEADPMAISILLDESYPELAKNMIFVAGERVITDPLAVPFSLGRNLLCIYSKRYIDNPPEQKSSKQHHNKQTMELMRALLKEGGQSIYVAPSGGRDRPNAEGVIEVAPFDPQSIEMFYLMAQKSGKETYFYPMALATYDMLPPPEAVQTELGESRVTKRGAIHLAIGPKIDMEQFPGDSNPDKRLWRKARADYIWSQVCKDYQRLIQGASS
jgi:glycerol-3-phosphate O-acyltransferase